MRAFISLRHRPHLEIRLADWAHRPATAVAVRVLAWRRLPIPLTPRYHVVTRYDDWCDRDGAWLTETELRQYVDTCTAHARLAQVDDLPACIAAAAGVTALLATAQREAKMLPPTLWPCMITSGLQAQVSESTQRGALGRRSHLTGRHG